MPKSASKMQESMQKDCEPPLVKKGEQTMKILVLGAGVLGCNLANDPFRAGKDVALLGQE